MLVYYQFFGNWHAVLLYLLWNEALGLSELFLVDSVELCLHTMEGTFPDHYNTSLCE